MKKAEKQGILSYIKREKKKLRNAGNRGDEDGTDTGHEKTQESDRTRTGYQTVYSGASGKNRRDVVQGTGTCYIYQCGLSDKILSETGYQGISGIQTSAGQGITIWDNGGRRSRDYV